MTLVFQAHKQRDRLLRSRPPQEWQGLDRTDFVPVKHKPCAARVYVAGTIQVERAIARTSPAGP
jgi:hypothetical protein